MVSWQPEGNNMYDDSTFDDDDFMFDGDDEDNESQLLGHKYPSLVDQT